MCGEGYLFEVSLEYTSSVLRRIELLYQGDIFRLTSLQNTFKLHDAGCKIESASTYRNHLGDRHTADRP